MLPTSVRTISSTIGSRLSRRKSGSWQIEKTISNGSEATTYARSSVLTKEAM